MLWLKLRIYSVVQLSCGLLQLGFMFMFKLILGTWDWLTQPTGPMVGAHLCLNMTDQTAAWIYRWSRLLGLNGCPVWNFSVQHLSGSLSFFLSVHDEQKMQLPLWRYQRLYFLFSFMVILYFFFTFELACFRVSSTTSSCVQIKGILIQILKQDIYIYMLFIFIIIVIVLFHLFIYFNLQECAGADGSDFWENKMKRENSWTECVYFSVKQ